MKLALGTQVDMTVFRKLRELGYHASYSHNARFYTLDEIVDFDALGLWSFRAVWFSRHGTLLATAEACVKAAEAGYFSSELEDLLHVSVKDALGKLVRDQRLAREAVTGRYLYCSADPTVRKEQLLARQVYQSKIEAAPFPLGPPSARFVPDELKAAIVLFFSLLDEQQRRLYAGLESLKLGHGGDRKIAELLGLDVSTVARGRQQLLDRDIEVERVRRAGAGRPKEEKKRLK